MYNSIDLYSKLQQSAKELPIGYSIIITIEKESGGTSLIDPSGYEIEYPCNNEYGLIEQVSNALDYAKQLAS